MSYRRLFDGIIYSILILGIIIGLTITGVGFGIYFLCQHIIIGWV